MSRDVSSGGSQGYPDRVGVLPANEYVDGPVAPVCSEPGSDTIVLGGLDTTPEIAPTRFDYLLSPLPAVSPEIQYSDIPDTLDADRKRLDSKQTAIAGRRCSSSRTCNI